MSYSLFISDLHLDAERPWHLDALESLLKEHAGRCDALYILGDLFETWIGDDDDDPFYRRAIAAMRRFSDSSSQLYFMHGNRDFLLGKVFLRDTGGELIPEGSCIDLYGEPTVLVHGDSLCIDDHKHQAWRQQALSAEWQQEMLAKPLAERRMIAQMLRMQSMQGNANKPENIMDVTPAEVVRVLEEHGARQMIHGHTHRPAVHEIQLSDGSPAKRWVLGDWNQDGWKILADSENGLSLQRFAVVS